MVTLVKREMDGTASHFVRKRAKVPIPSRNECVFETFAAGANHEFLIVEPGAISAMSEGSDRTYNTRHGAVFALGLSPICS